ncbi:MAG: UDP-galactose-lipid carrier transferase [Alphaproteobacteria bacterium BRH_c36]|nr:MAG: UDP-galactose-lipid carrier transferase [Alphaproteobacteria bacterium BRH_c36]
MADGKKSRSAKGAKSPETANDFASFELNDPKLPRWIAEHALQSGGYPYSKRLAEDEYKEQLQLLQIELLKLQGHIRKTQERIVIVFEGRDTAGKGGCIARFMQHLNPRHARAIALTKPSETELGQWYFQRYVQHLPTSGDMVMFDRSWYNRAGVERVMGFCNEDQLADFLREAPQFEALVARDGIQLFKIFLTIGREMQLKRLHDRQHDPLKRWKLTPIDLAAIDNWDAYTDAKEDMFRFTHTTETPWTVIRSNDKRRARLEAIRLVLNRFEYEEKDDQAVGKADERIIGSGHEFFYDSKPDKAG